MSIIDAINGLTVIARRPRWRMLSAKDATVYHHFLCREVVARATGGGPLQRLEYLESRTLLEIINGWLGEDNKLSSI